MGLTSYKISNLADALVFNQIKFEQSYAITFQSRDWMAILQMIPYYLSVAMINLRNFVV